MYITRTNLNTYIDNFQHFLERTVSQTISSVYHIIIKPSHILFSDNNLKMMLSNPNTAETHVGACKILAV